MEEDVYYSPPKDHDEHIKSMGKWLAIFFSSLFLIACLCFLFAHKIAAHLPFSVEKQFVKPYEVMADRWLSDQLGDPRIEAYLQELADNLAEAMELPEQIQLSVHYVDNEEANAFATLGGHIFVLSGLVEMMPDENSLAMILAHEISHIKHRDPMASMGRGVVLSMLLSYFAGGSTHGENLSSLGGQLGLMTYSRQQEKRSDIDALKALHAYYGHVTGYDFFFKEMNKLHPDDESVSDWLQTHPDLPVRIETLEKVIDANAYKLEASHPLPEKIASYLNKKEAPVPDAI
ncbi:MAG: M48 family metallopeptidase [Verrucomicrobiota bacterium]